MPFRVFCPSVVSLDSCRQRCTKAGTAVNMISGLSGRNYEDKLKELRLESLEKRRIYIDMLQTFKIIRGFDDVKSITGFNTVGSGEHRLTPLTADPLNLMPSRSRLELRANFLIRE